MPPFRKGQSGNPAGRKKGVATRLVGELQQAVAALRDFNRLNAATTTARELYDAMLEVYPDRVNPGSLWGAAKTAKKAA
jgi:hypothetical protein